MPKFPVPVEPQGTGVPRSQDPPPPIGPYSGHMPRNYGDPRGAVVFYERDISVLNRPAVGSEGVRRRESPSQVRSLRPATLRDG